MFRLLWVAGALLMLASACSSNSSQPASNGGARSATTTTLDTALDEEAEAGAPNGDDEGVASGETTVRLVTHDSFTVSEDLFEGFTAETGIAVEVVGAGDAGEVVARAILTAGEPEGDVMYGIDNTFLQRGLDADLFEPYQSPALGRVPAEFQLDAGRFRVTPINFGDVCVNYWADAVPGGAAPVSIEELTKPEFAGSFVTQDPEASSPGFAFLLATIAVFGEDGWEDYWRQLADNGLTVTSGWNDAYYGEFVAGGGEKAIVTSYATSPVAEVLFAEPAVNEPPTGVVLDGCFRQVEFAGILAGTNQLNAAQQLIDFMLSNAFQEDIPLNMFVSPVSSEVELPGLFAAHAAVPTRILSLDPAEIEAKRADWTERWVEIVLR